MKNKSLLIATVFAASAMTVSAQDLTSKKGETMLPEAGDWAISFDATPFLNYAGRMFSNAGATSPSVGYTNGYPWAIKGKMFKDEKTAYRAGIRLGFGSNKYANEIAAPQPVPTSAGPDFPGDEPIVVEDSYKAGYNGIVLTGGLEMRRGKTRLQGYYGGELVFGMMGTKDVYTYGNALTSGLASDPDISVTAATTTDWSTYDFNGDGTADGLSSNMTSDHDANNARYTEKKSSTMMFGLRGFIGCEYFILPKISIGAEYGWGLGFMSTKMSTAFESQGVAASTGADAVGSFTSESKKSGFAIDSDITGTGNSNNMTGILGGSGSLNIIFHF